VFNKNEFKAQIVKKGLTVKKLAEYLGINEATVYRKINADGDFTRDEINKLIDILQIEEPMKIFFAEKLA